MFIIVLLTLILSVVMQDDNIGIKMSEHIVHLTDDNFMNFTKIGKFK